MTKEEKVETPTTEETMTQLQQAVGYFQTQLLLVINDISVTLKDLKSILEK